MLEHANVPHKAVYSVASLTAANVATTEGDFGQRWLYFCTNCCCLQGRYINGEKEAIFQQLGTALKILLTWCTALPQYRTSSNLCTCIYHIYIYIMYITIQKAHGSHSKHIKQIYNSYIYFIHNVYASYIFIPSHDFANRMIVAWGLMLLRGRSSQPGPLGFQRTKNRPLRTFADCWKGHATEKTKNLSLLFWWFPWCILPCIIYMDWSEIMSESMVQSQNLHVDHHCHLQKLEFSGYIRVLVCLGESTGKPWNEFRKSQVFL